ncbi:MAG: AAA family ATPase, partial [Chloroflexi bacterium]|nr:AAA family ATPase [Chloroflexota bacterium]
LDSFIQAAPTLLQKLENPDTQSGEVDTLLGHMRKTLPMSEREKLEHDNRLQLARDLLVEIGGITPAYFDRLHRSFRDERQVGLAKAIQTDMNDKIRDSLNLAKWWSQDSQFRLAIDAHEQDVVLTITDRTSRQYTFDERSDGLRYFLSYLVQALKHLKSRCRNEILLMDEPDTLLSNQGQQDLLRVLNEFTEATDDRPGAQVIYVTHSPFLIDRNRGDRIRVLNKGISDEGVRVVRDVGKNHFEPIRTALGEFVGETVFIGNCNLILEGMADQIYVAGMSEILGRGGQVASTDYLDLNRVTLVAAGGASDVPYRVYLARGLDADKPAVIVLLDGDEAGDDAVKEINRTTPYRRKLLRDEYITQITLSLFSGHEIEWDVTPRETEDLVPAELAVRAATAHLEDMHVEYDADLLTIDAVKDKLTGSVGMFEAIHDTVDEASNGFDLRKVPFARHVVAECRQEDDLSSEVMRERFAILFHHLTDMQRKAERERSQEAIKRRVKRETSRFFTDRFGNCTKADVSVLLDTIAQTIDDEFEGQAVLTRIDALRAEFSLSQNPHERIAEDVRPQLRDRLEGLRHAEVLASQPRVDQGDEQKETAGSGSGIPVEGVSFSQEPDSSNEPLSAAGLEPNQGQV